MITKQDISRGEFDDSLIRAFSFAKDICGLLYITLRGWYGYFNVNSPVVLCYYSIFEMRSSQICKNDRENLHVILHLHLERQQKAVGPNLMMTCIIRKHYNILASTLS